MRAMITTAGAALVVLATTTTAQPVGYRMSWSANYGAHALLGGEIVREVGGDGVLLATNDMGRPDEYCEAAASGGILRGFASGWPNAVAMGRAEVYDTWTVSGGPGWIAFEASVSGTLRLLQYVPPDPATFVAVYFRADLFRWAGDHWDPLAGFEPWAAPDGLRLAATDSIPAAATSRQDVWVAPGDRLLTAAVLLPTAATLSFSQYPYPSAPGSGDSDFYDSATTALRALDPGIVLASAARDATPVERSTWGAVKLLWR